MAKGVGGGTLVYSAPETLEGGFREPPCDIWSFGIILYEMAVGKVRAKGKERREEERGA